MLKKYMTLQFITIFGCLLYPFILSSFIMTRIRHTPNITLFGDFHNYHEEKIEKDHLTTLLTQLQSQNSPCRVFVEDKYSLFQKQLKSTQPHYIKHMLLAGMTERIRNLNNSYLNVSSIEHSRLLCKALDFFIPQLIIPIFYGCSPRELSQSSAMAHSDTCNDYQLTFQMLIQELRQIQQELCSRKSLYNNPKTIDLIDALSQEIQTNTDGLANTLHHYNIDENMMMLDKAIDLKLNYYEYTKPQCRDQIRQLAYSLNQFACDYVNNTMNHNEWKHRKKEIIEQANTIHCSYNRCEVQQEESDGIFCCGYNLLQLPILRYFFYQHHKTAHFEPQPITPQPTAIMEDIYKYLLNLRLLVIDAYATLDILNAPSLSKTIVIAGDWHIRNISRYLTYLDYAQQDIVSQENCAHKFHLDSSLLLI